MKKIFAVILVLVCLVVSAAGLAEAGASRYEKLFTDYTWRRCDFCDIGCVSGTTSYISSFKWLKEIHLPDSSIIITENETGNAFITYLCTDATSWSLPAKCVGELSISSDEKTIIVNCVSGVFHGVYIYKR